MDFSRLTRAELVDYLNLNNIQPSGDLVSQASLLFNEGGNDTRLTTAVVDLYLATEFMKANPDLEITLSYLDDLTLTQLDETIEMFGLNPEDADSNERLRRIISILDPTSTRYLEPEEEIVSFSEYVDDEDIITPSARTRGLTPSARKERLTPEERRTLDNAREIQERLRSERQQAEEISRLRFAERLEQEDIEREEIRRRLEESKIREARLREERRLNELSRDDERVRRDEERIRRDEEQRRQDEEKTKRTRERYYEHLDLSQNPRLQQEQRKEFEERVETRIEPRPDVNYYGTYFGGRRPAEGTLGAREPRRVEHWYDQFKHEQKFKEVKCLTFNVCFQCMTGIRGGSVKRACDVSCRNNIRDYINQGPDYDFVALQEATNWEELRSSKLNRMTPVEYKPGVETMVLFYRETLALDTGVSIIKSYLQDINRPMIILFFPNLCVFNIHAGHGSGFFKKKYDFYELDNHLAEILGNARINKPGSRFTVDGRVTDNLDLSQAIQVRERLSNNYLVVMGDMNTDFKGVTSIKLFQDTGRSDSAWRSENTRTLTGFHNIPTCCDPQVQTTQGNAKSGSYDQVLVSEPGIVMNHQVPLELKNASDHLPVTVSLLLPY